MTQWCVERCLPFVPLPDSNQMVGVPEIQLSEDGGLVKRSKGRVEKRKRVLVLDRDVVDREPALLPSEGMYRGNYPPPHSKDKDCS